MSVSDSGKDMGVIVVTAAVLLAVCGKRQKSSKDVDKMWKFVYIDYQIKGSNLRIPDCRDVYDVVSTMSDHPYRNEMVRLLLHSPMQ